MKIASYWQGINMSIFIEELIDLELVARDKEDAITQMAQLVVNAGRGTDTLKIVEDVLARDAMGTPQIDGIAIPHARTKGVSESSVVVARTNGVSFDADEDLAEILFLILVPDVAGDEHIEILSGLARRMMDPDFTLAIRNELNKKTIVQILEKSGKE